MPATPCSSSSRGPSCKAEPSGTRCATAAEIAANTAQEIAAAEAEFSVKLPRLKVQQRGAAKPRPPYATTTDIYADAEKQATALLADSKARGVEFNKKNTADAAVGWEILTNAVWGKKCADTACVAEIKKLSSQMRIAANLVQMAKPDESSMAVQGKVGAEYGPKFKAAVNASLERAAKL